jgi:tRNA dimethylallyltransferase
MLYFKALREGLNDLPQADPALRAELEERAQKIGWPAMHRELARLDPETAARLKPTDAQRIQRALEVCLLSGTAMSTLLAHEQQAELPYRLLQLALLPSDRAVLHERIAQRFDAMLKQDLLGELEYLKSRYVLTPELPSMRCVGYRQAWQYLEGECNAAEMRELGIIATRQLAKRQLTWLRGMEGVTEFDCLAADLARQVRGHIAAALVF